MIVPSLPGYPGGGAAIPCSTRISTGCWRCASSSTRPGLAGADLVGRSVGGAFAAEIAAIWPESRAPARADRAVRPVRRGRARRPIPGRSARDDVAGLMCADAANWTALVAPPEGANSIEWPIEKTRASEAAARAFWPLGNTRLEKRLRADRGADARCSGATRTRSCRRATRRSSRTGINGSDPRRNHRRRRTSRLSRPARRRRQGRPRAFLLKCARCRADAPNCRPSLPRYPTPRFRGR